MIDGAAVNVLDFGAVGDGVTDDTVAIQLALDSLDGVGGVVVVPAGKYKCTASLLIPSGVILQGAGVGLWDTVFHNRPKQWTGTSLLFSGTGAKTSSLVGITDQPTTGGIRGNYKLSNWMNSNAVTTTPATPLLFSAAVTNKQVNADTTYANHWGMRDIRIAPWIGVDGFTDYSDDSGSMTSLGADWDVGVFSNDSEYERFDNVQVVGYWRKAGTLRAQGGYEEYSMGERGMYSNYVTQGYRGLVLRAGDVYPTTAATTTTVEIPWHDSQYWEPTGSFEAVGGIDYTYTSLSQVGDKLTFVGVTPDSSGLGSTQIRSIRRGSGVAGSTFTDTYVAGLNHVSGDLATDLGFAEAGFAFEVSGFPLRGYSMNNFKVQNSNSEPYNTNFGNCDDVLMNACQFESGAVVASPKSADQSWATYKGSIVTLDLRMSTTVWSSVDKTDFTPRIYFDDSESFNPQGEFIEDDIIITQPSREKIIRLADGKGFRFEEFDGTDLLQIFASGNFAAGVDATQAFGISSRRWNEVYGVTIRTGSGATKWTSGTGSPEGSLPAEVGSMYTDEAGGAGTTLYVKETGAGSSTGWVAK